MKNLKKNWHKNKLTKLLLLSSIVFQTNSYSAQIDHSFSSPSFSGVGYSSHVLTLKQLEDQAKATNKSAADALKNAAEMAVNNTPQAQFVSNLQSRIYSQLAKQVTDSLFGATGTPTCTSAGDWCGNIENLAGNSIQWKLGSGSDAGLIVIQINNITNSAQNATIKVPVGTFGF